MSTEATKPPKVPRVPPSWFVHLAWRVHRALYKLSGGRFLWTPENKRGWGALRLTTVGRKSGQERTVILGYLEDGRNFVVAAMNGWDEGHPAWWLNLMDNPEAVVRLADHSEHPVQAVEASGEERDRLWRLWLEVEPPLETYAAKRSTDTPVIVFEPRAA